MSTQTATQPGLDIGSLWTPENMEKWQKEEFHPDLLEYAETLDVFGTSIRHPILFDVGAVLPGLTNLRYEQKRILVDDAIAKGNIEQIVFLHERPYRFEALMDHAIDNDAPIWEQSPEVQKLAERVWIDSENIHQYQEEWLWLYRDRPEGAVLGDQESFRKLPDQVTVYRGGGDDSFLSWSTKREVAEFFARRFSQYGGEAREVRSATINKADIFAYYTSRDEYEVLTFVGMGN